MVANLIDQTIYRFPRFSQQQISVEPLEKGGSDRKFFRIAVSDERSLILAKYGTLREENRHYVEIAQFLAETGVRVPEIYFHDESEGLIWMEDLGDRDLWSYRNEPWEIRRGFYEDALEQLLTLHTEAHLAARPTLQAEFNAELYRWEQHYFLENCLGRYFQLSPEVIAELSEDKRLSQIAEHLAGQPRVYVHRDFQSQNIVIKESRACFIDFQGMRPGLPQYDLASLLLDPYVSLTAKEREELLEFYLSHARQLGHPQAENFAELFDLCAMQRLMQALGAYGFLGLVKERPDFLAHIPAAMKSLCQVLGRIEGLERLSALVAALPES